MKANISEIAENTPEVADTNDDLKSAEDNILNFIKKDDVKSLEEFIQKNSDVKLQDLRFEVRKNSQYEVYSVNIFHIAAAQGKVQIIEYLAKNGFDLSAKDEQKLTPLHYAAYKNRLEAVQKLIELGADVNLKYGSYTPLNLAAKYGKVEIIKELINHGAKINEADSRGATALHYAISKGQFDAFKLLLEAGANLRKYVTLEDIKLPIIHFTVMHGQLEILEYLLELGLDPNQRVRDLNNRHLESSPIKIAQENGHANFQMITLLLEYACEFTKNEYRFFSDEVKLYADLSNLIKLKNLPKKDEVIKDLNSLSLQNSEENILDFIKSSIKNYLVKSGLEDNYENEFFAIFQDLNRDSKAKIKDHLELLKKQLNQQLERIEDNLVTFTEEHGRISSIIPADYIGLSAVDPGDYFEFSINKQIYPNFNLINVLMLERGEIANLVKELDKYVLPIEYKNKITDIIEIHKEEQKKMSVMSKLQIAVICNLETRVDSLENQIKILQEQCNELAKKFQILSSEDNGYSTDVESDKDIEWDKISGEDPIYLTGCYTSDIES